MTATSGSSGISGTAGISETSPSGAAPDARRREWLRRRTLQGWALQVAAAAYLLVDLLRIVDRHLGWVPTLVAAALLSLMWWLFAVRQTRHAFRPMTPVAWATLLAQALVTLAPTAVFGLDWLGVWALLGGALLTLTPFAVGLTGALAVAGGAGALIWQEVGSPAAAVLGGVGVLAASAAFFGLVLLASASDELARAQGELVQAAVLRERARFHERIASTLKANLRQIRELAHRPLGSQLPAGAQGQDDAGEGLAQASRAISAIARSSLLDSRKLAHALPSQDLDPALSPTLTGARFAAVPGWALRGHLAGAILSVVLVLRGLDVLLAAAAPLRTSPMTPWFLLGAALLAACIGLQLVVLAQAAREVSQRVAASLWGAQLLVTVGLTVCLPPNGAAMLGLPAASAVLLFGIVPGGWMALALLLVAGALLADPTSLTGLGYGFLTSLNTFVFAYALTELSVQLSRVLAAQAEMVTLAVIGEKGRQGRDLHDILGPTMSALALKSSLAAKLVDRDPDRARAELGEIDEVARRAIAELDQVRDAAFATSVDREVEACRSLLAVAGISVSLTRSGPAPPQEHVVPLAGCLREGANNVLRHSDATRCTIRLTGTPAVSTLRIANDGLRNGQADSPGRGLSNLAERAGDLGGQARAWTADGWHFLELTLPVHR